MIVLHNCTLSTVISAMLYCIVDTYCIRHLTKKEENLHPILLLNSYSASHGN